MARLSHIWSLLAFTLASLFGQAAALGQFAEPSLVANACPARTPPNGIQLECFGLRVPESWDTPGSAMLELPVLVFSQSLRTRQENSRIRSKPEALEPLVYLHGGPGGRLLDDRAATIDIWGAVLRRLRRSGLDRLILISQRGTDNARAQAMDCPAIRAPEVMFGEPGENLDDDSADERQERALKACAQELGAAGIDLAGYSTASSARDLRALVDALNLARVNLLAASYGARLAVAFAEQNPGRVAKMVLDSPDPLGSLIPFERARNLARSLAALARLCRDQRSCNGLGLRFNDNLDVLRARARENGLPLTLANDAQSWTVRLGPLSLLDVIYNALYQKALIETLPLALNDAVRGNSDGLARLAEAYYFDRIRPVMWTNIAVSCNDYGAARIIDTVRRDALAMPKFSALAPSRERAIKLLCMDFAGDPPGVDWSLSQKLDMPVLIFTGGLDPVTPGTAASHVAGLFQDAMIRAYPEATHGILALSGCAWRDMGVFLNDPARLNRRRGNTEVCNDLPVRLRFQSAER